MPQIGPLEILVVAVVALIVFGPEKLPDLARKVGRTATELRRIANEAKVELQTDLSLDDDPPPPRGRARSRDGLDRTAEDKRDGLDRTAEDKRDELDRTAEQARPEGSEASGPRASTPPEGDEETAAEADAAEAGDESHGAPKEG